MSQPPNLSIIRVIARLNVGGPAIQAILMTQVFRDRGYRALLLTGQVAPGESSMDYLACEKGVEPVRVATMSRRISFLDDLVSLWRLIRIFRRERPTVVHTHTAKAGTLGRIAAIVSRVPVRVHTFHGHVFSGYFAPSVTRIFLAIERFLSRHTDRIFAVSESQRRELVDTYRIADSAKVVSLPLGLDLHPFLAVHGRDGNLRSTITCSPDAPLIGWVGRLTPIKKPELLVDTASRVRLSCPAARFVIVGDGESRLALQQRISLERLDGIVDLIGHCQDMSRIYADLDFLLLTSQSEGTPVALLEAMAAGKTFVATDVGGVRDLTVGSGRLEQNFEIFDNGILAPLDATVLARAVQFLTARPELCSRMGAAARAFVAPRFSHLRLADDLERIYLDLAREKALIPAAQAASAVHG